jgi:hypothetical protein
MKLLSVIYWRLWCVLVPLSYRRKKALDAFNNFHVYVTKQLPPKNDRRLRAFYVGALIWIACFYNIVSAPPDMVRLIFKSGQAKDIKEAYSLWAKHETEPYLSYATMGTMTAKEWLAGDFASADMSIMVVKDEAGKGKN